VLKTGHPETFEEVVPLDAGQRIYQTTKSVCRDLSGKVIGLITISHDVTQQRKEEERKDDFISMASHELKTPVTAIKALTQLFEQSGFDDAMGRDRFQERMNKQVERLSVLIARLLDTSKLQKGTLDYSDETFAFDVLVRDTVKTMQDSSPDHRLVLEGHASATLWGDRERIGQAISNLISNAVEIFSPRRSSGDLMGQDDGHVRLEVSDHGIGIAKKDQERIFDRFYRVPTNTEKTFAGLGIGLYMASEIVHRHVARSMWKVHRGEALPSSSRCRSLPARTDLNVEQGPRRTGE
jgi:signal transduction histidine kinase